MKKAIDDFILYLRTIHNFSINSLISYGRDLNQLCAYLNENGRNDWRSVTEDNLTEYVSCLFGQGCAPATVARHMASMKSFFHYLLEAGEVDSDITDVLNEPIVERKLPAILSINEVNALLNQPDRSSLKGKRDAAMLELLYATGMRVSELVSLGTGSLDFKINSVICENNRNIKRSVPFGMRARKALLDYLENARNSLVVADRENDILFLNCRNGSQMSRQGFWKLVKNYGKAACIKAEINPYTLRHSFAVHLVENGADLKFVQEMLGYAELSSTSRYGFAVGEGGYMREMYTRTQKRG